MQWKCYINSCQSVANLNLAFWNFLELFFSSIFYLWSVEYKDVKPADTEGQLCSSFCQRFDHIR